MRTGRTTASGTATGSWLRRLAPAVDPWVRLVCFPHSGGTAAFYRPWRAHLPPDVELYAVQYPGRLDRIDEPCVDSMDRLADEVTAAVDRLSDRTVALFGHSLGAMVAYEVARRLPARGGRGPARLFVSGHTAPTRHRPGTKHLVSDDALWDELRRLGGTAAEVLAEPEMRAAFLPALRNDYRLVETYRPPSGPLLDCPVSALVGDADSDVEVSDAAAWAGSTRGEFTIRVFPGGHFYLVGCAPQVVDEVLRRLAKDCPGRQGSWAGP